MTVLGFSPESIKECALDVAQKFGCCTPCNTDAKGALLDVTGQENAPPVAEIPPVAARNLGTEIEEAAPVAFNPKAKV